MPTHWTYTSFKTGDDLYQGDIIARDTLLDVLGHVHKHFTDPKYLAFIVLTQTCDLVLRKSSCKAKHISLAVIRPLSGLIPNLLGEICQSPRAGVFVKERRRDAEDFLRKVLNQNEQAQGWVYLHPDGDVGVAEPAVAMLRISISLRAKEHYEMIRLARRGRLDTEYRNKLGWLKGNLYSRIDTTDWGERESGDEEERRIIGDLLDGQIGTRPPLWVPATSIAEAKRKVNLDQIPEDRLAEVLMEHAPKPPLEVAVTEVKGITEKMRNEFTDKPVETFKALMEADTAIMPLASIAIVATVREAISPPDDSKLWDLMKNLWADRSLRDAFVAFFKEVAEDFLKQKGPRQLKFFFNFLANKPILSADARLRLTDLVRELYGPMEPEKASALSDALSALKCPPELLNYLRMVVVGSIQESVADLVASRLNNSTAFKKTLKIE